MSDEYFIEPDDVSTLALDWGTIKWTTSPEVNGAERFSCGVVLLEPGDGHELHTHPNSDEILFFISGEGEQTVAGETRDVAAGDTIFIPEGIEHSTINTGWEPLKFLAIYAPPGPEEVVAESPGAEIIPAGEIPTSDD